MGSRYREGSLVFWLRKENRSCQNFVFGVLGEERGRKQTEADRRIKMLTDDAEFAEFALLAEFTDCDALARLTPDGHSPWSLWCIGEEMYVKFAM